jgi:Tol biopolymer transport system component
MLRFWMRIALRFLIPVVLLTLTVFAVCVVLPRGKVLTYMTVKGMWLRDVERQLSGLLLRNSAITGMSGWSPDGEYFAITALHDLDGVLNQNMYLVSMADFSVRSISYVPTVNSAWLVWSLDGSRAAYLAQTQRGIFGNAFNELRIIDIETRAVLKELTQTSAELYTPTWSPDERRLAFVSKQMNQQQNTSAEIRVLDINSGQILPDLTQMVDPIYGWSLDWSPDNRWLAYTHWYGEGLGLFILNSTTGEVRRLFSHLDSIHSAPTWSAASQELAFINYEKTSAVLHVVNIASGQDVSVFTDNDIFMPVDVATTSPAWSPDGKWLAFMTHARGTIYGLNRVDGQIYPLVPAEYDPGRSYTWSSDSRQLRFVSLNSENAYTLNMADFTVSTLTIEDSRSMPVWQP